MNYSTAIFSAAYLAYSVLWATLWTETKAEVWWYFNEFKWGNQLRSDAVTAGAILPCPKS